MIPPGMESERATAVLLRILRRYADSRIGTKLGAAFAEMAEGEAAGLVAFEEGSDERIVESVLAGVHQTLAALVAHLHVEIGSTRLDALKWLEDVDPDDFGKPS